MTRIKAGVVLVLILGTGSAVADSLSDCTQARNSELRLRACSDIVWGPSYTAEEKALAYRNRGNVRADAGAGPQAVADFTEAIRLRPADAANYAGRGRARLAVQELEGAIADYSEALRLGPVTASLHVSRGHVFFVKGDFSAAIADFTEAIRIDPKSASAFNRRGLANRRAGNFAQAMEDYSAAIALNPAYALAYNNRAYLFEAQDRKEDAMLDFQTALLLDPSLVGARDGLRRLGVPDRWLAETRQRVEQGKALVQQNCSGCHAVGPKGRSTKKKAPEFRSLHARHPSLALREPLSRGIAAPHDEMPKFALSGPEIDSIVAYINSLSPSSVSRRGTKTNVPSSEPADIGDSRKGLSYARKVCAECHNVLRTDAASPNPEAPTFRRIANTPGMSVTALTVWSRTSHPKMPNLIIEPTDMDNLIAYIVGFRDRK